MSDEPNFIAYPVPGPERTEYVTRTVNVHRAPTDQSVALLKEFEQAARDKIEHSIAIGGNGFECVVYVERDCMSNSILGRAVFKLNGKKMRAKASVEGWNKDAIHDLPEEMVKAVADEIAREVLVHAFKGMKWPPF